MKAITKYLVKIDKTIDTSKGYYETGGVKIYLPPNLEFERVVPQTGTIIDVPKKDKYGLKKGDEILFGQWGHTNKIDDNTIYLNLNDPIYGIIEDGNFRMVGNNLVVNLIEEESKLLLGEHKKNEVIVKYTFRDSLVNEGDKIYIFDNHLTTISLLGEKNYIINMNHVPAYEKNGELVINDGWMMVEPELDNSGYHEADNGIYMPIKKHDKKMHSTITKVAPNYDGCLSVGDKVFFLRREYWAFKIDGELKYFTKDEKPVIGHSGVTVNESQPLLKFLD